MTILKTDELVQRYIQLRDKKSQLKAAYEAEVAPLDDLMGKIESALLKRFQEQGVESSSTKLGTAYVAVRSTASLADWDSFKQFLDRQDHPFDYIERRVSKAAVEAFKKEHQDLPPGINWSETRTINVRRPTN